jgi:hypothetical protein
MKRILVVLLTLLLAAAYLLRPLKGDDTPKEQTYVGVFYCLHAQTVIDQRRSGKHKIVVGTSLSSLNPDSTEMRACVKDGGTPMAGYVEITPPFATLDEGAPTQK